MQTKPIEIFVSGLTYKQIHMLYGLDESYVFRDRASLNCSALHPHYDFILATVPQNQEHCKPVLDYIIRGKDKQYDILKNGLKDDSIVKVLPTISLSNVEASLNRVSTMWTDVKTGEDFGDGYMVVQCVGGANGWAHVCCPRELVEDVIAIGLSRSRSYLKEKFGDIISVSEARPDITSSRFFDSRVIVRPHLTSIHNEYRIIFSKDAEGKLDKALMRTRRRTKVDGEYFQANLLAADSSSIQVEDGPRLILGEVTEISETSDHYSRKEETRDLKLPVASKDQSAFYRDMIHEMKSYPIDNPNIHKAVTELMDVIPYWFGAIDLAVTHSGKIYVLEFSPEFGTKYVDTAPLQTMAKDAFKNYVAYMSKQKD